MQYLTHSEAGHAHKNEDAVAVQIHARDQKALICVLADGQGGQFGGGVASRLAVQSCLNLAAQIEVDALLQRATWRDITSQTDAIVEQEVDAGFTTLIGLCVTQTQICGASCGDSAALLIEAEAFDELNAAQRKNPPLGSGGAVPMTFQADFAPGSQLLLMSDGVWKFVGFDKIVEGARQQSGVDLILRLRALQLAGNNGKLADDFSLIMVS